MAKMFLVFRAAQLARDSAGFCTSSVVLSISGGMKSSIWSRAVLLRRLACAVVFPACSLALRTAMRRVVI